MKKLRNNKHFITFVCLIVGSALLCSAAVANIGNAGGYEAYKDGLLGLFSLDNYSATLKGTVLFDGEVVEEANYTEQLNRDAGVGEAAAYNTEDDDGLYSNWYVVNPADHESGDKYTSYYFNGAHYSNGSPKDRSWSLTSTNYLSSSFSGGFDPDDADSAKVVRLLEAAADLLVGDIKNNFVYLGGENGSSSYRVSLSQSQLPEIVNAAISLVLSEYTGYNGSIIYEEPVVPIAETAESTPQVTTEAYSGYGYYTSAPQATAEPVDPDYYTSQPKDDDPDAGKTDYEKLLDSIEVPFADMTGSGRHVTGYSEIRGIEDAVDLEYNSEDSDFTVRYDAAWREARSRLNSGDSGYYIITKDCGLEKYASDTDYYLSLAEKSSQIFFDRPRVFLALLKDEPYVDSAICEFTLDRDGHITQNTLEGTLLMKLLNGERHTLTIRIDAEMHDIGTTKIALPVIEPMDYVTDRSRATYENGYEYTITQNGITTVHSEEEDSKVETLTRFRSMNSLDRFDDLSIYLLGQSIPYSSYTLAADSPELAKLAEDNYIYANPGDIPEDARPVWYVVDKGTFDTACAQIFANHDGVQWYSENMGCTPNEVTQVLLDDYRAITGSEYEGTTVWDPSGNNIVGIGSAEDSGLDNYSAEASPMDGIDDTLGIIGGADGPTGVMVTGPGEPLDDTGSGSDN